VLGLQGRVAQQQVKAVHSGVCASRDVSSRGQGLLQPVIGRSQVCEALPCASKVMVGQAVAADGCAKCRSKHLGNRHSDAAPLPLLPPLLLPPLLLLLLSGLSRWRQARLLVASCATRMTRPLWLHKQLTALRQR
jgi:hypothetical protein